MRGVGQVQRFGPELHLPALRKPEVTEQTAVEIECARTANRVQRRGSNGPGDARSKGQWIEVRLVRTGATQNRDGRFCQAAALAVVRRVERSIRSDRERLTGECGAAPVQPPASTHL